MSQIIKIASTGIKAFLAKEVNVKGLVKNSKIAMSYLSPIYACTFVARNSAIILASGFHDRDIPRQDYR